MAITPRLAVAAVVGLAAATIACAGPDWPEVGDAGSLPGDAQKTRGDGKIEGIMGEIDGGGLGPGGGGDFEDMFLIRIPDPTGFSATTVVLGGPAGSSFDTQLFLFDADGLGALGNDEAPCPLSGPDDGPPPPDSGPPCDIVCEPGDVIEMEPCGQDTNGGCTTPGQPTEPIMCGDTVCGTAWADGGQRDTDWFEFTVSDPCVRVTATLQSEFSGVVAIIPIPDCSNGLGQAGASNACTPFQPSQAIVGPGQYAVFVAPEAFDGLPCGTENDYRVTLDCEVIEGASQINPTPLAPIEPGLYYIAITFAGNDPVSPAGPIFSTLPNEVSGPDGPGGALPISDWQQESGAGDVGGAYLIVLEGAEFAEEDLCPGDVNGDRAVDVLDLIQVILHWGAGGFPPADVNRDGDVNVSDLIEVVLGWGPCPQGGCPGDGGDCFVDNGTPGCDDIVCCEAVCSVDVFCCDSAWDQLCADQALERCLPGACCFPDGTCADGLLLGSCVSGGGVFQGPGSVCMAGLCPPCEVACRPDDLLEGEPCGADLNGGCNGTPVVFGAIACGETVCGEAWADGGVRDTDWYLFNVAGTCAFVTAQLFPEFPGIVILVDGINACAPVVIAAGDGQDCQSGAAASAELAAGDYVVLVTTVDFDGSPCGSRNDYRVSLSCGPCPPPCELACLPDDTIESEACGADENGGCNSTPPVFDTIVVGESVCGTAWADGGFRDTDWYELVLTEPTDVTITLESEFPGVVFLLDLVNCGGVELGQETTDNCLPSPPLTVTLLPGTYQVAVATQGFDGVPCGTSNDYRLTVSH